MKDATATVPKKDAATSTPAAATTETPKPEKKENETAEAFKKRMDEWEHNEHQKMLKSIAAKRMPRVLDAIATVGGLATHLPTPEQQKKLVDSLRKAVDEVEQELKGTGEQQSRFQL